MYQAGSVAVILGGRLNPEGFLSWGRKVAEAKAEKAHSILLGAKDEASGPLQRFIDKVLGAREATLKLESSVNTSMSGIAVSVDKTAASVNTGFGEISKGAKRTADSLLGLGDSAKEMSKVVDDSAGKASGGISRLVEESTAAKDKIVKNNEEIAASAKRGYANPVGGGGGGAVPPGVVGGAGGHSPEEQAKKTTKAWKEGFSTLSTIGKWASVSILGVGAISVKWAADFQRQMEMLATQAGVAQKDIAKLSKAVLDMAPQVGFGPAELAKGLYHIESAGIHGAHALDVLKLAAEGAKVGGADLENTTNALVAVWRSSPKDIRSVAEAMGVMNDIVGKGNMRMEDLNKALTTGILAAAKGVGLGLRDVGAALDVMTSRGVPAEQAATRLRTTLTLMGAPTKKATEALAELGMSHDQLALDMRGHGLSYALQDLKDHLDKAFPPNRKLTYDQERQALMDYGKELEAAGEHGKSMENKLIAFRNQLSSTGSAAVAQSQIITEAFGGSRMGTTMQMLVQNSDDVKKHFDDLNKAGAAKRFQTDWQRTQKDFSVQASQLWGGIKEVGIGLGDFLIPKIKDTVKWLIEAGKWLGRHKTILKELEILFGVVMVAAIGAFVGKLIKGIGEGLFTLGKFFFQIARLPFRVGEATTKAGGFFDQLKTKILGVKEAATSLDGTNINVSESTTAEGGAGAPVEESLGAIDGMITGVHGTMAPGSAENPLAVVVMAGDQFVGARGAASEAETMGGAKSAASRLETSAGGVILPRGVEAPMAPLVEEKAPGLGTRIMGGMAGFGGRLMGGLGVAGMGMLGTQILSPIVSSTVSKGAGSLVNQVGMGASAGALLGSIIPIPGVGTGIGAAAGGAGALIAAGLKSLFGSSDHRQQDLTNAALHYANTTTIGTGLNLSPSEQRALNLALGNGRFSQLTAFQSTRDQGTTVDASAPMLGRRLAVGSVSPHDLQMAASYAVDASNQYTKAGLIAGQAFTRGMDSVKNQSTFGIITDFKAQLGGLPPEAQRQAAQSVLEWSAGLEANGRLPKGSMKKIIDGLQSEVPGLQKYLHDTGMNMAQDWANTFSMDQAKKSLDGSINDMIQKFGYLPPKVKQDFADPFGAEVSSAMKYMEGVIKNTTGSAHDEAVAKLRDLRDKAKQYYNQMEQDTTFHMAGIADKVKKGSADAAATSGLYFSKFAGNIERAMSAGTLTTADGVKLIAQALNQALSAYGVPKVPIAGLSPTQALKSLQSYSDYFFQGQAGVGHLAGHAQGGKLPGSEFGLSDVMTLVDPQGVPRARMAGDEAIFNRHQMPYVEAGLQMLGFNGANDLWNTVTTPHYAGYSHGGALRKNRFATGGYLYPYNAGMTAGRTDMGFDVAGAGPIAAIGDAIITRSSPQNSGTGWPGAGDVSGRGNRGAMVVYQLTSGIDKGKYVYLAENVDPTVSTGQRVKAGQVIAIARGQFPYTESGWAGDARGDTLASMTTGYVEGQQTPAGMDFTRFVQGLQHGKLFGSTSVFGPGSGLTWKNIAQPKSVIHGALGALVNVALKKATDAANHFGENQISSLGAGAGTGSMVGNILQIAQMAAKSAGVPWVPSIVRTLLSKESSGGYNLSPHNYGGGLDPAGPFQVISSTFGAYEAPGHTNRMNPFDNALAAFRYIKSRYGTLPALAAATGLMGSGYKGYASGGQLPGFASGGRPWAPLPSGVANIPGFRPPRVRRGRGGLHVVGGGGSGSRTTGRGGKGGGSRGGGSTRGTARHRQPITQATATVLKNLGLGSFADDQNLLGKLDQQYTSQENLFNMFDGSSGNGLPKADLDTLMGIREQQWDILYKEWKALPGAISHLQGSVGAIAGHAASHTSPFKAAVLSLSGRKVPHNQAATGMFALDADIASTESDIASLQHEVTTTNRQSASIRHRATGQAMAVAENYASVLATYTTDLTAITDQRYALGQSRLGLRQQSQAISSGSSGTTPLSTIVGEVMSGITQAPSGGSGSGAKKAIQQRITSLTIEDHKLAHASQQLRQQMKQVTAAKNKEARRLRAQGFDAAWGLTLKKWNLQDKITYLKQRLARLKELLKQEKAQLGNEQAALTTLENWQSGGLQGNEAIINSLGDMGMNILGLYQEGADLPTPGRKDPTLSLIEQVLGDKPPKGLGLVIPSGLLKRAAAAAQSYTDFTHFQAARQALYAQFGSNFVGAGANPFAGTAGLAAGVQYYGAASGAGAGPGTPPSAGGFSRGGSLSNPGPGGTTINIENHFAAGPPDPHTWSAGVTHEINAAA